MHNGRMSQYFLYVSFRWILVVKTVEIRYPVLKEQNGTVVFTTWRNSPVKKQNKTCFIMFIKNLFNKSSYFLRICILRKKKNYAKKIFLGHLSTFLNFKTNLARIRSNMDHVLYKKTWVIFTSIIPWNPFISSKNIVIIAVPYCTGWQKKIIQLPVMAEKPGNESIVVDAALPLVAGYPSPRPSSSLAPGEEILHAPAHKSASLQHL
jgi:hypothetical protein